MSAFDGSLPWKEVPQTVESLRPSFYTAFVIYYGVFVAYGLTAALLGSITIANTAPDLFRIAWGWLIVGFGVMAALGVVLSYRRKRPWLEVLSTCMLIGLMVGYCVALLSRAIHMQDPARAAGAWLPVFVSVFPVMRILWIGNTPGSLLKRKPTRHAR